MEPGISTVDLHFKSATSGAANLRAAESKLIHPRVPSGLVGSRWFDGLYPVPPWSLGYGVPMAYLLGHIGGMLGSMKVHWGVCWGSALACPPLAWAPLKCRMF